jgi:hypothetical protein
VGMNLTSLGSEPITVYEAREHSGCEQTMSLGLFSTKEKAESCLIQYLIQSCNYNPAEAIEEVAESINYSVCERHVK